jgi:hypothetical protein
MKKAVRTEVLDIPYSTGMHKKIADVADPLAQAVMAELSELGVSKDQMKFEVLLQLREVDGTEIIEVEAVYYDPRYDHDAEFRRAMSLPTPLERYSEMPGDVAFRIDGKSNGSFRGGHIGLNFNFKYKAIHGEKKPNPSLILHAIIVSAWRVTD